MRLKHRLNARLNRERMKKFILLVTVITGLILMGCAQPSVPGEQPGPEAVEPPPELYGQNWISPGKVNVGNFHAGASAEWPITIHNGSEEPTKFEISFKQPNAVDEGFVIAPEIVQDWVIISEPTPVLEGYETREVLIALVMPEDAVSPGPQWEFWIAVQDVTQEGMVRTELAARWLVSMRD